MLTSSLPHESWMERCLTLAARGAGHVSPNPLVGAVLVGPDGRCLGEGWHAAYGRDHAEPVAIRYAEARHGAAALRTATLYVNLEPCSHHGKTPPCADLVLEKGIPRVVVGIADPFPAVAGRGLERLRAAGVEVEVGILQGPCLRLNEGFIHHVRTGRPLVTLKVAQTLDGHVATRTGHARWISGQVARRRVHEWRATLDGVLVGRGTAAADDPALTVRHVAGRQPRRLVLDRTGTLPPSLQLFTDAQAAHTLAVVAEGVTPAYAEALTARGGTVWQLPTRSDDGAVHLDLAALLNRLGVEGGPKGRPLQTLLVEAGPGLASALLQQDLVDRYALFVAPKLLGAGVRALHDLRVDTLDQALTFADHTWSSVGNDLLFMGYRHATDELLAHTGT
ncbi:MAG: bifunctional diaminohydroxyphosphoribosylaminopyrimidine deaminase/5-amino-6-(5-phosphoribosylamino)uracil reductase RibD [Bacteroidota bacterium]